MHRLLKFYRLTGAQRKLLIKAACLLMAIRIALVLISLRTLRNLLAWRLREIAARRGGGAPTLQQIIWAIERAARIVPRAACLVQALAALRLCQSAGYPVAMKIGAAKDGNDTLYAHAWVEYRGEIIFGAAQDKTYTPLLIWNDRGWRSATAEQP